MIQYQIFLGMKNKDTIITSDSIKNFINYYILDKNINFTIIEGDGYYNGEQERVTIITIITNGIDIKIIEEIIKNIATQYKKQFNQEHVIISKIELSDFFII